MSANTGIEQPNGEPESRRGVLIWVIKTIVGILFTAAILFVSAGRLDWVMGWVYLGIFVGVTAVTPLTTDPELLIEERGVGKEDSKRWDRRLVGLYGLVSLPIPLIIAGLDLRFGWFPQIGLGLQIGALVLYLLAWGMHIWAMATNKFFSKVIRIQKDRGHTVITGGPYRYVRHPGYVGAIVISLATPLILGSLWALIPGTLGALLIIIRTALEDKTLQEELEGYKEYTEQVHCRLLPGVW